MVTPLHPIDFSCFCRVRVRVALLLGLALFLLPLSTLAAPVSAQIPLDSWVYPALDKLAGSGLIDSVLAGTRPYSRIEAGRQIQEARQQAERAPLPLAISELLAQLEEEFAEQLVELHGRSGEAPESYIKPLRHLEISSLYRHGDDSMIGGSNISARQFSLDVNNSGRDYPQNSTTQLLLTTEARFGGFLLLEASPVLLFAKGEESEVRLEEGRAALEMGYVEFSVGRQSLWWGQGRHGSLILSNNAKPLDMLRLTTPVPVLLPWAFKYFGPFRFDLFLSKLEKERPIPGPYLSGLRLNFKPLPWVEFGASRTIIFGGQGRPHIGLSDFATILSGRNLNGGEDTSDSLAALDASIRLPFIYGAQIYGEFGGEDEAGHFIAKAATLYGLYLPKIDATGRGSLRVEYADLSGSRNHPSPWYRHSLYRSGYTYEGKILGHHVGGSAKDLFVEVTILLPSDLTLNLNLDLERRGYDQVVKEEHLQPGLELNWLIGQNTRLEFLYRFDRIHNLNFVQNNDQNQHFSSVGIASDW